MEGSIDDVEVVGGIMDWLGELVGERQGVRILPTAHFSMGEFGPIPIVEPPPRYDEPAITLAVQLSRPQSNISDELNCEVIPPPPPRLLSEHLLFLALGTALVTCSGAKARAGSG